MQNTINDFLKQDVNDTTSLHVFKFHLESSDL